MLSALARPCWRKTKHESQGKAEAAIRGLLHRDDGGLRDPETLTTFRCRFCGWWHVGHDRTKGAGQ